MKSKKNKTSRKSDRDNVMTDEEYEKYQEEQTALSQEKEVIDFERKYGKGAGFVNGNGNGSKKNKEEPNLKTVHILKHSSVISGVPILAETVIIGQVPRFALSELSIDGKVKISLVESIKDEVNEYLPLSDGLSRAYTFKDDIEFHYYVDQARREDFDSLYLKVKSIWRKYIDADDFHISIAQQILSLHIFRIR